MVSAEGEEIDAVVGLEVGADDYVTKSYRFRELLYFIDIKRETHNLRCFNHMNDLIDTWTRLILQTNESHYELNQDKGI
jgi:DNA-binding response OmpR family regulator